MLFQAKASLNVCTINRILQTALKNQLQSTGNVSTYMTNYIDDNKYLLSDNRIPFIQHKEKNSTFYVEKSNLPYNNWIDVACERLKNSTLLLKPFTLIGQSVKADSYRNLKTTMNLKRKSEEDIDEIDYGNINALKRRRIEETSRIFTAIKNNISLETQERRDIIKVLTSYKDIYHVKELVNEFRDEDGEMLLNRMSEDQRNCLDGILKYAYPADFNLPNKKYDPTVKERNPFYKIFLIEGSAGCGKSSVIEGLNFYTYKHHSNFTKLLYITQTNVLCQSMSTKCNYNKNMQYLTFFRFLSILDLNYYDKKQLLLNCDALKIDAFQHTCGSGFLRDIKDVIKLPCFISENNTDPVYKFNNDIKDDPFIVSDENFVIPKKNEDTKPRLFIVFDEIYTVSSGKLSLFLFIVRCLKLNYPLLSIYCILIGDKSQLLPFTKVEDIKLNVPKDIEISDENETKDIQEDDDINICSLISQSESLANATRFVLNKQFRIVDEKYNNFVNRVRYCDNREDAGIHILEEFTKLWKDKVGNDLSIIYPLEEIRDTLASINIKKYNDVVIALERKKLFDQTLNTTVFCFTNKHAHYYNIALALSYWNQIEEKCNTGTDSILFGSKSSDFIVFSIIYSFTFLQTIDDSEYKASQLINQSNYLVNVLPLIRYCPYKMLASKSSVARLSIVYVLDWILDKYNSVTHVIVYSPDTKLIFSILPQRFEMNLFKNSPLFGIPLQLAFSSTFASSQGLTLHNKIAISCANISKSELYVCLTRIKSSKDLVRIF
ncbi:ATP dependent DNA helicase [Drosophila suzukii associated hytrosavirus 1]|nr:ATP dependent DNA helicase [Drosophila suzukii associated hytrosavirus 1]